MSLAIQSQYDYSNVVHKCRKKTEIYTRVCGYFRPTANFNKGALEAWRERKTFDVNLAAGKCPTTNAKAS